MSPPRTRRHTSTQKQFELVMVVFRRISFCLFCFDGPFFCADMRDDVSSSESRGKDMVPASTRSAIGCPSSTSTQIFFSCMTVAFGKGRTFLSNGEFLQQQLFSWALSRRAISNVRFCSVHDMCEAFLRLQVTVPCRRFQCRNLSGGSLVRPRSSPPLSELVAVTTLSHIIGKEEK